MHLHLLRWDAADLGAEALRTRLELRRRPDVDAVGAHVCGAVHRLHGRVREQRQLVRGLDLARRTRERAVGIAVVARLGAGLGGRLAQELRDAGARDLGVRPVVPLHVERVASFLGVPVAVGDHGHAGRDLHHVLHAGDGLRLGGVEVRDLAADGGAARHHGDEHAGPLDVDAELGRAVHLGRGVEPLHPRAEDLPVFGLFERGILGDGERRGLGGELAVRQPPLAPGVDHGAPLGAAIDSVHCPRLARGRDEHLARGGAGLAERRVGGADAGAAAGALHAEHRVDVRLVRRRGLDLDLGPVGVQLLGDEHGQGGGHALTHLGAVHHDEHAVVRTDPQPGVGGEGSGPCRGEASAGGEMEPDDEPGAGRRGRLEKVASRDWGGRAHVTLLARPGGWPPGCADRCRSDRCSSWRCRCRRPWGAASGRAAPPRP